MGKQVAFYKKDEELIERILSYQREKGIPPFTEAVRRLCTEALERSVNVRIDLN